MTRAAIVATSMGALLALGGCDDDKKEQAASPAAANPRQEETCVTVKDRTGREPAQIVDSCTGQTWFYNTTL